MAFHGKYGHLSSLNAAIASLKDIEKDLIGYTLADWCDESIDPIRRYDDMRIMRMIEGLQRVVLLNGGNLLFSRLPNYTNLNVLHETKEEK